MALTIGEIEDLLARLDALPLMQGGRDYDDGALWMLGDGQLPLAPNQAARHRGLGDWRLPRLARVPR